MSYGFDTAAEPITLPKPKKRTEATKADTLAAAEAGKALGFVPRDTERKRKPGPKRVEPQSKISLTGPERVLSRFQDFCDREGGLAYWQGVEELLDRLERK